MAPSCAGGAPLSAEWLRRMRFTENEHVKTMTRIAALEAENAVLRSRQAEAGQAATAEAPRGLALQGEAAQ